MSWIQHARTPNADYQIYDSTAPIYFSAKTINITPTRAVALAGNGSTSLFESTESQLEANFLLIREHGDLKLFLTLDLLFVGPDITSALLLVARKYLKDENIWISASHTHNAPATDANKPQLGELDPSYLTWLIEKLSIAMREILHKQELQPAFPVLRTGVANLNINRRIMRLFTLKKSGFDVLKIRMGPNPLGKTDRMIRRLDLVSSTGQLLAVVWHYTCHPTSFFSWNIVSSHFPGVVRNSIRGSNQTIPILFFQGFAGDIRPRIKSRVLGNLKQYLQEGRKFRDFTRAEYVRWSQKLSTQVNSAARVMNPLYKVEIQSTKTRLDSKLFVSGSASEQVVIQVTTIGPICLVGISAEPTLRLSSTFSTRIPSEQFWPIGYLEDVYGYLPTAKQLKNGGYEVDGFCQSFNCDGLVPGGASIVTRVINDQLGAATRATPRLT